MYYIETAFSYSKKFKKLRLRDMTLDTLRNAVMGMHAMDRTGTPRQTDIKKMPFKDKKLAQSIDWEHLILMIWKLCLGFKDKCISMHGVQHVCQPTKQLSEMQPKLTSWYLHVSHVRTHR